MARHHYLEAPRRLPNRIAQNTCGTGVNSHLGLLDADKGYWPAIATLEDVVATLRGRADLRDRIPAIEEYRRQYGV